MKLMEPMGLDQNLQPDIALPTLNKVGVTYQDPSSYSEPHPSTIFQETFGSPVVSGQGADLWMEPALAPTAPAVQ